MHITILGSGTCVASLDRSAPCIRVVSDATTVLLDTGPGCQRQMLMSGTTFHDIDLLCYTHLHVDHTADFVPLLFASKYAPKARERDLAIMAAPGFFDFYNKLTQAYGDWIIPERYTINWLETAKQPVIFGSIIITSVPVKHTPHSIAFRLQDCNGASLVYSGDTDYCGSIVELARDCDVLILECSFPEGMHCEGHLTPDLAGRIAAEANCKQLVLTHFYPICNPRECCSGAAKQFDGTITAAYDLYEIEL